LTSLPISPGRLLRALPLAAACGLVAYGLVSSAGAAGAVLLVLILALAGALVVWARRADVVAREVIGRTATGALL
jgi:hypothetical protein